MSAEEAGDVPTVSGRTVFRGKALWPQELIPHVLVWTVRSILNLPRCHQLAGRQQMEQNDPGKAPGGKMTARLASLPKLHSSPERSRAAPPSGCRLAPNAGRQAGSAPLGNQGAGKEEETPLSPC